MERVQLNLRLALSKCDRQKISSYGKASVAVADTTAGDAKKP